MEIYWTKIEGTYHWFLCWKISVMPCANTFDTRIYGKSLYNIRDIHSCLTVSCAGSTGFWKNRWFYCKTQSNTTRGPSILLKLDIDISLLLVYEFSRVCESFKAYSSHSFQPIGIGLCLLWRGDRCAHKNSSANL